MKTTKEILDHFFKGEEFFDIDSRCGVETSSGATSLFYNDYAILNFAKERLSIVIPNDERLFSWYGFTAPKNLWVKRWEKLINSAISEYHKLRDMPPAEKIKLYPHHTTPFITQGKRIITGLIAGKPRPYPFIGTNNIRLYDDVEKALSAIRPVSVLNPDINYLSRDKKDPNMISFLPNDRVDNFNQSFDFLDQKSVADKYCMSGKPLKVLKKVFYMTQNEQEAFLRAFRIPELHFVEEPAEKIGSIYHAKNYLREHSLGKSCMRKDSEHSCKKIEVFKLLEKKARGILVAYDKEDTTMVLGRALLWNVEINGKKAILMDRIYVGNYSFEGAFMKYAKKQGWYRKEYQDYKSPTLFRTPYDNTAEIQIELRMRNYTYSLWPFLDTMIYMKEDRTRLTNSLGIAESWGDHTCLHLQETNGRKQTVVFSRNTQPRSYAGEEGFAYDEITEELIDADESVLLSDGRRTHVDNTAYDDVYQHYILADDAVTIGDIITHRENACYDDMNDCYVFYDDAVTLNNGNTTHIDNVRRDDVEGGYILHEDAVTLSDDRVTHRENTVYDDVDDWDILGDESVLLGDGRRTHVENAVEDIDGNIILRADAVENENGDWILREPVLNI